MSGMTSEETVYSMPNKLGQLLYSLVCYCFAVAALVYFIVFTSGVYPPLSVNDQSVEKSLTYALSVNLGLLLLFGIQHSIMARKKFKQALLRIIAPSIERATYCLASAIVLVMIGHFWVPMSGVLWEVSSPIFALIVTCIGAMGWLFLLIATFQLDHFELFGVKQTYSLFFDKPAPKVRFKTPGFYKIVRHPIQTGVLIGVWSVPVSTVNHFVLALGMTVYIFVGLYFEEKDLMDEFGDTYRHYKEKVAKLIPFLG